jgi:hypothetical protein
MKKYMAGMMLWMVACAADPSTLPTQGTPSGDAQTPPTLAAEEPGRALGIADYQVLNAPAGFALVARDSNAREVSRVEGTSMADGSYRFVFGHRERRWEMNGASRVDRSTEVWSVEGTMNGQRYTVGGVGMREETFQRSGALDLDADSRRMLSHWLDVMARLLPQTASQDQNCLQCIGTVGGTVIGAVSCVFGNVFGCFSAAGGAIALAGNASNCLSRNNPCSVSPTRQ